MTATDIIMRIANEVSVIDDQRARLATQVGMLQGEIRKLLPDPLPLPVGSYSCEATIDGLGDCIICYEVKPRLYVTVVQIAGCEFAADVFSEAVQEDLFAAAEIDCIRQFEVEEE